MFDYRASLVRTVDSDTVRLLCDTGFGGRQEEDVRLLNVSAPELRDPGGVQCRDFTAAWLGQYSTRRWPLLVSTVPNTAAEPGERRSFVRYLGTVSDITDPGRVLNDDLAAYLRQHPEWGSGS